MGASTRSIYSADYQRLYGVLRQLRDEAGLTQTEVASRLRKPQSFVSKYEAGDRRLDLIELRHVLDALGVKPGCFLERLDPGWLSTD